MSRLRGKVAIVTGAGQGVGQGIAYALAAEGAAVVVAGRTESKLQDTCRGILERGGQALPVVCDVFEADDVETYGCDDGRHARRHRHPRQQRLRRRVRAVARARRQGVQCAASSRGRSRRSASCARVIRT